MSEMDNGESLLVRRTRQTATSRTIETQTSNHCESIAHSSDQMIDEETQTEEALDTVQSSIDPHDVTRPLGYLKYIQKASPYEPLFFNPHIEETSSIGDEVTLETEMYTRHLSATAHSQRKRLSIPVNERQIGQNVSVFCTAIGELSNPSTLTRDYEAVPQYESISRRQPFTQEGVYNCLSEMQTKAITPLNIYESLAIDTGYRKSQRNGYELGLCRDIAAVFSILGIFVVVTAAGFFVYNYKASANIGVWNITNQNDDGFETGNDTLTNETSNISVSATNKPIEATAFLNESRMHYVIYAKRFIRGITSLSSELFILHGASPGEVAVYDSTSFSSIRNFTIPGSMDLYSIVACPNNNCLYLCDQARRTLYRYNLSDDTVFNRTVGGKCYGLSITTNCKIIATLYDLNEFHEYSPDGNLTNVVTIKSGVISVSKPCQSVQLASGDRFVVNHWEPNRTGVCIVNSSGHAISSYHKSFVGSSSPAAKPVRLAVDRFDNVLVAYMRSDIVEILSADLTHIGYISIPGVNITDPRVLYLDEFNRRLYIGLFDGRVFVLETGV